MTEYTFTYNILLPAGCNKSTLVLIRPEIRYDHTSANFYSYKDEFRVKHSQWTLGLGLSWIM